MAIARAAEGRSLASPTIKALISRRSAELIGLALGLLGLALLVALACYDPRDPSLNTATSRHTSNLAGPVGAVLADLLLQGFGVAGTLPGLPMLAAVLAGVPTPRGFAWPTVAGLGGAIGGLLASTGLSIGRDVLGPVGALMIWTIGLALAVTLTLLALGLSASEWRATGRIARRTARLAMFRGLPTPSLGFLRLPGWLRFPRHAGAVVRREPVAPTRLVPAMDEPPPVVTRTTPPA